MFKKIFTLTISLVFILSLSGMALAQNTANITQVGDKYTAKIIQTGGIDNVATIDQASSGGSKAFITQTGGSNYADVYWRNTSGHGGGEIDIIQYGSFNLAYHKNYSFDPSYQNDKIYQYGDDNTAYQRMRPSTCPSGWVQIFQGQDGSPSHVNDAVQDAKGGYNKIEQYGGANNAYQYTANGSGHQHAYIKQEGHGNDSDVMACDDPDCVDFVTTYDFDFDGAGALPVSQYQTGGKNNAYTDILGDNNHTCQWQEGSSNYAEIDIYGPGSDNSAKQVQLGDNNSATINISGNSNTACIYQNGSDLLATISQTGNFNVACIIQGIF